MVCLGWEDNPQRLYFRRDAELRRWVWLNEGEPVSLDHQGPDGLCVSDSVVDAVANAMKGATDPEVIPETDREAALLAGMLVGAWCERYQPGYLETTP